jgi:hypothetical protein
LLYCVFSIYYYKKLLAIKNWIDGKWSGYLGSKPKGAHSYQKIKQNHYIRWQKSRGACGWAANQGTFTIFLNIQGIQLLSLGYYKAII